MAIESVHEYGVRKVTHDVDLFSGNHAWEQSTDQISKCPKNSLVT